MDTQDLFIRREDEVDFVLAAYNAVPTRVSRLRRKAEELGYDPKQWFDNVEWVALKEVGQETVRYVANVNKYYFAFRRQLELLESRTIGLQAQAP